MKYGKIIRAKFIDRPNRFVAIVEAEGEVCRVHVKNTGRCRELLVPEATVYLEDFKDNMGSRKMRYSLIGVEKASVGGNIMINMDSQAPNKVVRESLESGNLKLPGMSELVKIKPEAVFGDSRLDFLVEDKSGQRAYIEVKGVTLENEGVAAFPDAPTERGIKHVKELERAVDEGYLAFIIFIIQMTPVKYLTPNDARHKAFGDALREGTSKGVKALAYQCAVTEDTLILDKEIPIKL